MNDENNIIKVEVMHEFTLFPKYPNILGEGENNNYGVVKWSVVDVLEGDVENNCVTVVGQYEGGIDITKTYTILAKETLHPIHGKQYELIFIGEILDLSNVRNQKAFLKTFLTEGQIEEMFKVLDNPLDIIQKHDIGSLKKVHGIGDYISQKIIERFEECKDYCDVYLKLNDFGLSPNFIQKLIKKYANPNKIIDIVKNNPYQLSFDIDGVGFKTADKIALNNGMDLKSPKRIKGYINYLLTNLGEKGNSYLTAGELMGYIFAEFDGKDNIVEIYKDSKENIIGTNISVAIKELENDNIIVVEKNEKKSQRKVYLTKYWELENNVAKELKRINNANNEFEFIDWQEVVKNQELKQGWTFTPHQIEGIKECLDNQIVFITGEAGTGKSSVLTGVLQALRCYEGKYSFAQCALSGRAGARMQEITGEDGSTIHRLLEFNPCYGFNYNENNKLPYDIIILDEISLVGGEIFLSLVEAIKTGSKLIILGDLGQLESIGCMNLASDLYNSKLIKTIELTEIHRQAKKSGITIAAHSVRNREKLFKDNFTGEFIIGELQDMHFSIHSDKENIRNDVIKYFKKYWNNKFIKDIMDIQILAPIKEKGEACVFNLNSDIQEIYNPPQKDKLELKIKIGDNKFFILREGDKVMNLKNNYKLYNIKNELTFVFNGWIGILEKINWDNSATIYFPIIDDRIIFDCNALKQNIVLGYASTVHKCLVKDTLILTNEGIKKIQDLDNGAKYNEAKEFNKNIKVYNGNYLETPSYFINSGIQDCLKFNTERNYNIECTYNHGLDVLSSDGYIEKKEAKNITLNDYLILNKGSNIYNNKIKLDEKHVIDINKLDTRTVILKQPIYLTKELAKFLGFMVADGTVCHSGIKLAKRHKEVVEDFQSTVKSIFGYDKSKIIKTKHSKAYLFECGSRFIKEFCNTFNELTPHEKRIPQCILEAPKEIQIAFLNSFMEDGTVNNKNNVFQHIEISANNKELIDDLRMMLLNMGIVTSYFSKKVKCKNLTTDAYVLHIYKNDAKILYKLGFNFISVFKKERFELINTNTNSSQKTIPYITNIIKNIINSLPTKSDLWIKNRLYYLRAIKKGRISKITLNNFLCETLIKELKKQNKFNNEINHLEFILNSCEILKVKQIENDKKQTYCLTMPETHKFIQNGFYGWNCQGSSSKVVLGVIDYSTPPNMRTKELVYTLLTRAEKECVLIGQNKAINEAIITSGVSNKNTFLVDLLDAV